LARIFIIKPELRNHTNVRAENGTDEPEHAHYLKYPNKRPDRPAWAIDRP
jgi:hypothetical protein